MKLNVITKSASIKNLVQIPLVIVVQKNHFKFSN